MVKKSHNNLWWLQKRRKSMKNLAKIRYLAKYTWKGRRSLFSNAPEISIKMWSIRFAIKNHQKSGQKVSKMAKYERIFVHSTLKFRRGISAGGIPNVLSCSSLCYGGEWVCLFILVQVAVTSKWTAWLTAGTQFIRSLKTTLCYTVEPR